MRASFISDSWLVVIDDVWDVDDLSSDLGLGLLTLAAAGSAAGKSSVVVTSRYDLTSSWDGPSCMKLREADNVPNAEAMLAGYVLRDPAAALPRAVLVRKTLAYRLTGPERLHSLA